jgi:hypothetical protein
MNLKTFDKKSVSHAQQIAPAISYSKAGAWTMNAALYTMLDLKAGDGVCLHQDTDNPSDWYISKSDRGLVVRDHHSTQGRTMMMFNSMALKRTLTAALQKDTDNDVPDSARMPVSEQPVKAGKEVLYAIITSNLATTGRGRKRKD